MVDYGFYATVYYGDKLEDNNEFKRLSRKAYDLVNKLSFGRIAQGGYAIDEELELTVKFTICEVIDHLKTSDAIKNNIVRSENVDDVGITFKEHKEDESNYAIKSIVFNRLGHTSLLDRFLKVWWLYVYEVYGKRTNNNIQ